MSHSVFSRRTFFRYVAGTAGVYSFSLNKKYRPIIRVGVIGCGYRGSQLLEDMASFRNLRVCAVCDPVVERAREASFNSGATVYANWEKVVSCLDVDAVVIAAPDYCRAEMVRFAFSKGKDVFCVPPMGLTTEEASEIRNAAQEQERVFQMGIPCTGDTTWDEVLRLVQNGELGELFWSQSGTRPPTVRTQAASDLQPHWRKDPNFSLGALATEFFVDLAVLLELRCSETPTQMAAAGGNYEHRMTENPDFMVLTCRYSDGFTVALTSTAYTARNPHPTVIRGSKGTAECCVDGVTLRTAKGETVRQITAPRCRETRASYRLALADWVTCVRTREKCRWNEEKSYRVQEVVCEALKPLRSRRVNV